MRRNKFLWLWLTVYCLLLGGRVTAQTDSSNTTCPESILSRLESHRVNAGETLESIAQQYGLTTTTLISFNPSVESGVTPGQEILIPPLNGIKVQAPPNATWKDLQSVYGVRADILFEVNGCQPRPNLVFVPGVEWENNPQPAEINQYTGLTNYPLAETAEIGLGYGWQNTPSPNQQGLFHSGIDLIAPVGTPVMAAAAGRVIYKGQEGNYGNLIIIDHGGGKQTRYAHLSTMPVQLEQEVQGGDPIGTTGTSGIPDITTPHLHFEVRVKSTLGWVAQDPLIHLQTRR